MLARNAAKKNKILQTLRFCGKSASGGPIAEGLSNGRLPGDFLIVREDAPNGKVHSVPYNR
jgi:hypothetical protein